MNHDVTIHLKSPRWKTILRPYCKTVRAVVEAASGKKNQEVTVVLADDNFIRELNRDFRGKDKATNVLSFPSESHLGDIILAIETIEREAKEQGKSARHHAMHMLVHGVLHLAGHDHKKNKEAAAMEALEIKILKKLGVANPYL